MSEFPEQIDIPDGFVDYHDSGKIIPEEKAEEFDLLLDQLEGNLMDYELTEAIVVKEDGSVGLEFVKPLDWSFCKRLTHLPDNMDCRDRLMLNGTAITELPRNLSVNGDFRADETNLVEIPDDFTAGGWVNLNNCTHLSRLPSTWHVLDGLVLMGCTSLTHLPDPLTVKGNLMLEGCTGLRGLPKTLKVVGNLHVKGCHFGLDVEAFRKLRLMQANSHERKVVGETGIDLSDIRLSTTQEEFLQLAVWEPQTAAYFCEHFEEFKNVAKSLRLLEQAWGTVRPVLSRVRNFFVEGSRAGELREHFDVVVGNSLEPIVKDVQFVIQICLDQMKKETQDVLEAHAGNTKAALDAVSEIKPEFLSKLQAIIPLPLLKIAAEGMPNGGTESTNFLELLS